MPKTELTKQTKSYLLCLLADLLFAALSMALCYAASFTGVEDAALIAAIPIIFLLAPVYSAIRGVRNYKKFGFILRSNLLFFLILYFAMLCFGWFDLRYAPYGLELEDYVKSALWPIVCVVISTRAASIAKGIMEKRQGQKVFFKNEKEEQPS